MNAFFDKTKKVDQTLVLVEDSDGFKFGGFCNEPWKKQSYFYGTGENFLFTFKDSRDLKTYHWTG